MSSWCLGGMRDGRLKVGWRLLSCVEGGPVQVRFSLDQDDVGESAGPPPRWSGEGRGQDVRQDG
jgi:hypothetical protein